MGEADKKMNPYLENPKRFAEVLNQGLFQGKPIINPSKLKKIDATNRVFGKEITERDIVKSYGDEIVFAILAVENQQRVHYAMPLRNYIYDGSTYDKQRKDIARKHKKKKDLKGDEYISRFSKYDKLIPVITLVVYAGENWDGPRQLHDMLNIPKELEEYKPLMANYHLNLLEISKIENLDSYSDELKLVFGFIKYQSDKKALQEFIIDNEKILEHVPKETGEVIQAVSGSNEILKYVDVKQEEVDMKTAFQEILEDCKAEAKAEGKAEGKTEGEIKKLIQLVCRKLKKQQDCTVIADALEEDVAYIQTIIEAAEPFAPEYNIDDIYKNLNK